MSIYKDCMRRFRHSIDSDQYDTWRTLAAESQDFYDGIQWSASDLRVLEERNQPPIVINQIAPKVDSIISQELQNQSTTVFTPRSFDPQFGLIAEALTEVAMNIQTNADTADEMSEVFQDQLIAGIGWMETDMSEGRFITERVDPMTMVWDIDDKTPQLTNSMFVCRMKWYDKDDAKKLFPAKKKEIEKLVNDFKSSADPFGSTATSTLSSFNTSTDEREPFSFVDPKLNKVLIVEQQYKESAYKYRYINERGQQKETFDEEMAEKSKAPESTVEKIPSFKIWRAYFTQDTLLEHLPLPQQIGEFSLLPTIHKRRREDNVPYGIVENSKDPQVEYNKRRSKMMHYLSTQGVIAEANAVDDVEEARREIARPDYWIEVKSGKQIDVQNNLTLSEGQARVMEQSALDIVRTMGVSEEVTGQQTNTTSGVGIARRQAASIGNKTFAFKSFERFKKRFGRVLGALIQSVMSEKTLISIFKQTGDEAAIVLNKPYEIDGKQYFENDISTLFFDVTVKQVPKFDAPPEQLAENLTNMIMNGQIGLVLQSPALAKLLGISNIDEIQKELQSMQPQGMPSPTEAPDGNTAGQ